MGGYNLLINGVYWGYTHLVNLYQLLGHPSTPTSGEVQKLMPLSPPVPPKIFILKESSCFLGLKCWGVIYLKNIEPMFAHKSHGSRPETQVIQISGLQLLLKTVKTILPSCFFLQLPCCVIGFRFLLHSPVLSLPSLLFLVSCEI